MERAFSDYLLFPDFLVQFFLDFFYVPASTPVFKEEVRTHATGKTFVDNLLGFIISFLVFMAVSSYGKGSASSGRVQIVKDLAEDIAGRHVIVVEDILDS
ncbi:MAG: hypothetical protein IJ982_00675, partial [Fibrobacter sp.]|nr:hypothetical protein [Fibrobacter sp.]